MEKAILFTIEEYDKLLEKFIDAWMEYQEKGYGCTITSNETGREVKDRDTLIRSFVIPWHTVFK